MTTTHTLYSTFLIVILSACVRIPLMETERTFIPYTSNEILIFHSNMTNETNDTIYVYSSGAGYTDAPAPVIRDTQHYSVRAYFPRLRQSKAQEYGRPRDIMYMEAYKYVMFYFVLGYNELSFYSCIDNLDSLLNIPLQSIEINGKPYNDVIILKPTKGGSSGNNVVISQAYWSRKDGFIRFDTIYGDYFELIEKHIDKKICDDVRNPYSDK